MPTEYTAQDQLITSSVGGEFTVALEAIPTAGYEWLAEFDAGMLQLAGRRFVRTGGAIGAAVIEHLTFKALAIGNTRLRLIYKRSWEAAAAKEMIMDVHIHG